MSVTLDWMTVMPMQTVEIPLEVTGVPVDKGIVGMVKGVQVCSVTMFAFHTFMSCTISPICTSMIVILDCLFFVIQISMNVTEDWMPVMSMQTVKIRLEVTDVLADQDLKAME